MLPLAAAPVAIDGTSFDPVGTAAPVHVKSPNRGPLSQSPSSGSCTTATKQVACLAAGFTLLDSQGGEIMVTGFNDAADKFDPIVQSGAVITMSKASLRPVRNRVGRAPVLCPQFTSWSPMGHRPAASSSPCHRSRTPCLSNCAMPAAQQFNTTRHDFEITLETQTQIDVVPEDAETHAIPSIQYHVRHQCPTVSSLCQRRQFMNSTGDHA